MNKKQLLEQWKIKELERKIEELDEYLGDEERIRKDAIKLIESSSCEEMTNKLLMFNKNVKEYDDEEIVKICRMGYDAIEEYSDDKLSIELAFNRMEALIKVLRRQLKDVQ